MEIQAPDKERRRTGRKARGEAGEKEAKARQARAGGQAVGILPRGSKPQPALGCLFLLAILVLGGLAPRGTRRWRLFTHVECFRGSS